MKQKYEKDWCIRITYENKHKVEQYLSNFCTGIKIYAWTLGAFYGIDQYGVVFGNLPSYFKVSRNLITDKEFDEMVQYFSQTVFLDNYEIY